VVWWCGGVVVWWCGGVVVWWGGVVGWWGGLGWAGLVVRGGGAVRGAEARLRRRCPSLCPQPTLGVRGAAAHPPRRRVRRRRRHCRRKRVVPAVRRMPHPTCRARTARAGSCRDASTSERRQEDARWHRRPPPPRRDRARAQRRDRPWRATTARGAAAAALRGVQGRLDPPLPATGNPPSEGPTAPAAADSGELTGRRGRARQLRGRRRRRCRSPAQPTRDPASSEARDQCRGSATRAAAGPDQQAGGGAVAARPWRIRARRGRRARVGPSASPYPKGAREGAFSWRSIRRFVNSRIDGSLPP
jgi:hypothetical protein